MRRQTLGLLVKKTTFTYHLERLERLGLSGDRHWEAYTGATRAHLEHRHKLHMRNVSRVRQRFRSKNFDIIDLKQALVNSTPIDLAAAIGGDGTFLRAAGWIRNGETPLVGFNSDPEGSHGELCTILPNETDDFINRLSNNQLSHIKRTRVRTLLNGPADAFHKMDNFVSHKITTPIITENVPIETKRIPELALNEVFIGELDSTAPSYVELSVNNSQKQKIKCSGVLISTGTGSTAWSQNVNALGGTECDELNVALGEHGYQPVKYPSQIANTMRQNRSVLPDSDYLTVTIREPIVNRVFQCNSTRFKARSVSITSRCYSGMVAIDGKYRYTFPAGAIATLQADKQNALLTFPRLRLNKMDKVEFDELFSSYI